MSMYLEYAKVAGNHTHFGRSLIYNRIQSILSVEALNPRYRQRASPSKLANPPVPQRNITNFFKDLVQEILERPNQPFSAPKIYTR